MFKTIEDIQKYLYSYIRTSPLPFDPDLGLRRTFHFLKLLGSPQEKLKVIHIAGTSGKGSTAFYMSRLLSSQGFKTGLHISPHLVDLRERFQINNRLLPVEKMGECLELMVPAIEKMKTEGLGDLSYFEILIGLAYFLFAREKVDYAVVETGFGGWHDATNTVMRPDKVCVLTRIGLDHTDLLGDTVEEIAFIKAKIIHPGNTVIANYNTASIRAIIEKEARLQKTAVTYVKKGETFANIVPEQDGVRFDFRSGSLSYPGLKLSTPAQYQAENAATALTVLAGLSQRDAFAVDEKSVRAALLGAAFAGRMETLKIGNRTIVMDGAHNPQKMEAFLSSLTSAYPDRKPDFLIAFKKGKNYRDMLAQIASVAGSVTATKFFLDIQDSHHQSEDPERILKELKAVSFDKGCAVGEPVKAFDGLMEAGGDIIVVTGSLYLLSCLHKHIHAYTHHR